jgi:hypothetical protein
MSTLAVPVAKRGIPYPSGWKVWRADTRAIVGGVLLAVCFTATMQITERIDLAISGGIVPILGPCFGIGWFVIAVFFYGLVAGLMTTWFNPIIAILTATGPLAPAWFGANGSVVVTWAALQRYWLSRYKEISFKQWFVACAISWIPSSTVIAMVHILLLHFTLTSALTAWLVNYFASWPGIFIAWGLARYISKSGIAG